jgi:hypothetical protein
MKKITFKHILTGIVLLGMVGIFSSCLSGNSSTHSVIVAYLRLKGATTQSGQADTTLVAGGDSLTITNIRLIAGHSYLLRQSNSGSGVDSLRLPAQMVRFSSRPTSTSRQPGNIVGLGGSNRGNLKGTYQALDFRIIQADNKKQIQPPPDDIFYDGGRYSLVIQGKYDNADFTFKSKHNFQQTLPITPPVTLPKTNAQAIFIVSANVKNWFLSNGGGFLDPSDSSNTAAINANIQNSFQITTQGRGLQTGAGTM